LCKARQNVKNKKKQKIERKKNRGNNAEPRETTATGRIKRGKRKTRDNIYIYTYTYIYLYICEIFCETGLFYLFYSNLSLNGLRARVREREKERERVGEREPSTKSNKLKRSDEDVGEMTYKQLIISGL